MAFSRSLHPGLSTMLALGWSLMPLDGARPPGTLICGTDHQRLLGTIRPPREWRPRAGSVEAGRLGTLAGGHPFSCGQSFRQKTLTE